MEPKTFDYGKATHNVIPMNNSCIDPLIHSGVGTFPRSAIPFLTAFTLAGNIATSTTTRPRPAKLLLAATSSPIAPKTSTTP